MTINIPVWALIYWLLTVVFEAIHAYTGFQKLKKELNENMGVRMIWDILKVHPSVMEMKKVLLGPLGVILALSLLLIASPFIFPISVIEIIKGAFKRKDPDKPQYIEEDPISQLPNSDQDTPDDIREDSHEKNKELVHDERLIRMPEHGDILSLEEWMVLYKSVKWTHQISQIYISQLNAFDRQQLNVLDIIQDKKLDNGEYILCRIRELGLSLDSTTAVVFFVKTDKAI